MDYREDIDTWRENVAAKRKLKSRKRKPSALSDITKIKLSHKKRVLRRAERVRIAVKRRFRALLDQIEAYKPKKEEEPDEDTV